MRCPDCDLELRPGQTDCPRCSFRSAMGAAPPGVLAGAPQEMKEPSPDVAVAAVPEPPPPSAPLRPPPAVAAPDLPTPRAAMRRGPTALLAVALPILLIGALLLLERPARDPKELKIARLFTTTDGPCRNGDQAACMAGVAQMRAMSDWPDGSLLLGDYKIAEYIRTQPDGARLTALWRRDQITGPELMELGDVAYAKNLTVSRSLFMYGGIKNNKTPVPEFIIGGVTLPTPQAQPLPQTPQTP